MVVDGTVRAPGDVDVGEHPTYHRGPHCANVVWPDLDKMWHYLKRKEAETVELESPRSRYRAAPGRGMWMVRQVRTLQTDSRSAGVTGCVGILQWIPGPRALVPFDVIRSRAQYFWTLWMERVKILPRGISLSSGRGCMTLTQIRCAQCGCKNIESYRTYTIRDGEQRTIYHCSSCDSAFSETRNTPIAQLKTPIAVIVQVLSALTEGVGINAATRLYGVSKNSIYRWQERLSGLKKPCSYLS